MGTARFLKEGTEQEGMLLPQGVQPTADATSQTHTGTTKASDNKLWALSPMHRQSQKHTRWAAAPQSPGKGTIAVHIAVHSNKGVTYPIASVIYAQYCRSTGWLECCTSSCMLHDKHHAYAGDRLSAALLKPPLSQKLTVQGCNYHLGLGLVLGVEDLNPSPTNSVMP